MNSVRDPRGAILGIAILAAMLLASCSASVSSDIRADGSARISIQAEVPAPLATKFRKLASTGASASSGPFFDAAAIRKSIAARPSLSITALSQPSLDSMRLEVSARSLSELATSSELKGSGLITLSRGEGWVECRFKLERGNAKAIVALLPGIDPYLLDSLFPPALDTDPKPLTRAEYEKNLRSLLGEKAMQAMEAANISLSVTAPGAVIGSGGASLSGSTLTARISIIEALVMENPIEFWLRWKQ